MAVMERISHLFIKNASLNYTKFSFCIIEDAQGLLALFYIKFKFFHFFALSRLLFLKTYDRMYVNKFF